MDAPTQGRLYLYYHHNTTGECASAECGYFLVSQTVRANTLSMSIFFGERLRDHDQWPIFITPSYKITTYLTDGWLHRFVRQGYQGLENVSHLLRCVAGRWDIQHRHFGRFKNVHLQAHCPISTVSSSGFCCKRVLQNANIISRESNQQQTNCEQTVVGETKIGLGLGRMTTTVNELIRSRVRPWGKSTAFAECDMAKFCESSRALLCGERGMYSWFRSVFSFCYL